IIQTLQFRKYVEMEGRSFRPTDVGRAVSKFLSGHFTRYVDYDFTAKLEDDLDAVSRGEEEWIPLMEKFWGPFKELVEDKKDSLDKTDAGSVRVLGT
ncbi:MAG: DNA topoisomerase I, partial [Xanthomonas perforans]|nr:DNA topoisomerase I [Xanthomonas perforans]